MYFDPGRKNVLRNGEDREGVTTPNVKSYAKDDGVVVNTENANSLPLYSSWLTSPADRFFLVHLVMNLVHTLGAVSSPEYAMRAGTLSCT